MPVEGYGTAPSSAYGAVREVTIPCLSTDAITLQWIILIAEIRQGALCNRLLSMASAIKGRRQDIYHTMRRDCSARSSPWDEQLLHGIAFAACAECRLGNLELARVHMKGCVDICTARRASRPGQHLSFAVGTLVLFGLLSSGFSLVPSAVEQAEESQRQTIVSLQAMERWYFKRKSRLIHAKQALGVQQTELEGTVQRLKEGSALSLSIDRSAIDSSPYGSRTAMATLYVFNVFIWSQRFSDDDYINFCSRFNHRLLLNLGQAQQESSELKPIAVKPSGLLYALMSIIYAELGTRIDYERIFVWEVARFVNLFARLAPAHWKSLMNVLVSWVMATLDFEKELLRFDAENFRVEVPHVAVMQSDAGLT